MAMYVVSSNAGPVAALRLKLEAAYAQGKKEEVIRLSAEFDEMQLARFQAEDTPRSKAV